MYRMSPPPGYIDALGLAEMFKCDRTTILWAGKFRNGLFPRPAKCMNKHWYLWRIVDIKRWKLKRRAAYSRPVRHCVVDFK